MLSRLSGHFCFAAWSAASVSIFIWLSYPALASDPATGRASVIDGDAIEIAGDRIRFHGIDAPESWRRCLDRAGKVYRYGW